MPVMMEKLYDALKAAGAGDDKARAAAVEAANFESALSDLRATQRLHTWMLGFTLAFVVAMAFKLFLH